MNVNQGTLIVLLLLGVTRRVISQQDIIPAWLDYPAVRRMSAWWGIL